MNYLLDTNIVLIYSRDSEISDQIEKDYNLFSETNQLFVSVVTVGELESIMTQRNYGQRKIERVQELLNQFSIIDINIREIIQRYGQIDAYSQGKHSLLKSTFSSRNMGKNDLWIAATSSVYDLVLITTDNDFDHLSEEFIKLENVDINKYKTNK